VTGTRHPRPGGSPGAPAPTSEKADMSAPIGRLRLSRLTGLDGTDHLVTDEEHCAGLARRTADFVVLCGLLVDAAPMVKLPGPVCLRCLGVRRAMVAAYRVQHGERPMRRRRGRFRCWVARVFQSPVGMSERFPARAGVPAGSRSRQTSEGLPPACPGSAVTRPEGTRALIARARSHASSAGMSGASVAGDGVVGLAGGGNSAGPMAGSAYLVGRWSW
jgi:hypothetical protein